MLDYLFGNKNIEKILQYLSKNKTGYAYELSRQFGCSLAPIQKTLNKLERGGLLVSLNIGKTRQFQFNPKYPFLTEIEALVKAAYRFLPEDQKLTYQRLTRKRPRRANKPLL